VENVEFIVGNELAELVKDEAAKLRAEGADLIVYSLHDGYGKSSSGKKNISNSNLKSYYTPSLSNGVVDIVFEAHTHQNYTLVDSYGVYHVQGAGENKGISHVEMKVNYVNGENKVSVAEYLRSASYSFMTDDADTEALEEKYADIIEMSYSNLGTVSRYYDDDLLEYKVAELYLEAGIEEWGDDYSIVLAGGFLRTRSPYNLSSGNTTYAELLSLFPFDNDIVLCSISGYKLKSKFIYTENEDYHNVYTEFGEDVKESVSDYETYYVVVDTYTALYASNGLTIIEYLDGGTYARDLLAEAIRNGEI
jgi:2',3'-cyclic-nucleotide 2'-phosphodiesterase (5'-nucleotidase family)